MDLRPEGQPGWWKPLGVERKASDVSPFKKRIPARSPSLCSARKWRVSFETGATPKARSL